MSTLLQDLRFGIRLLLQRPGLAAAAIVSLALGIGANATVYTWMQGALLRPLAGVASQDEIVYLQNRPASGVAWSMSYPDYRDYRDRTRSLAGVIVTANQAMSLTEGETAERVYGAIVSGNYFDVLGVRALHGRTFRADEDRAPGRSPVVVLGYGLWQRRFAGSPSIVGRTVALNGQPFTVVGVTPPGFVGVFVGLRSDLWVPMMMQAAVRPGALLAQRGNHWLSAFARLRPGVTLAEARADLNVVARGMAREDPGHNEGMRVDVYRLRNMPTGAPQVLGPILFVLAAVVAVVLLIACANVANLLLGRAIDRRREVAIRVAMGASRGRLVRQLLTESALLALAGGAGGLLVARWSAGLLMAFLPPSDVPFSLSLAVDGRVLGFTLAASVATGVLFGLVPAFQASLGGAVDALKEEAGTVAGGRRKAIVRSALVLAQVALSVVLLVGAGLFLRALAAAQRLDPGFNTKNVALASIDLFPNGYSRERGTDLFERLLARVRTLPGVEAASLARSAPFELGNSSMVIHVEGYEPAKNEDMAIDYQNISPDFFRTLQIPVLRGREFTEAERGDAWTSAIVNESMAKRFWRGQDPLGRRFRIGSQTVSVVGVAADTRGRLLREEHAAQMYLPLLQAYRADVVLHVRTADAPAQVLPALRTELKALDPNLPLFDVRTMAEQAEFATFAQRIGGTLLTIFGALALVLATVGLYGVVAYAVGQRWHELGIRMALGAAPADVVRLVLRHGAGLAAAGLLLGLAAAAALTRLAASLLQGVSPTDPITFAAVSVQMAGVALAATCVPARRAGALDPLSTLRHQ